MRSLNPASKVAGTKPNPSRRPVISVASSSAGSRSEEKRASFLCSLSASALPYQLCGLSITLAGVNLILESPSRYLGEQSSLQFKLINLNIL